MRKKGAKTPEHPNTEQQPDRGQRGYTPPRGVDPRSLGAAPANGLFTASASSSARGTTTAEERAIYNQAVAQRRAVDDYEQTRYLGTGEAHHLTPQLPHWAPGRPAEPREPPRQGATRPAEPREPPRQGAGQKGGKQPREGLAQKVLKTAIRMDNSKQGGHGFSSFSAST